MQLTEVLNSVKAIQVTGEVQRKDVSGIFYDSRQVKPNSIFVAIKGFNVDGHKFIYDAINQGAQAIVLEDSSAMQEDIFGMNKVTKILVKDSRKALAEISNCLNKEPSKSLKLIGITGTNGKTTTTYFLKSIFQEAGNKTGLIGTIANFIGDEKVESSLTTPEASDLNQLLAEMVRSGCNYAIMEVSSHSLILKRVYGLNFFAGLFTNITSDHLDFHNTFEEYLSAKKLLFDSLPDDSFAIINIDDTQSKKIVEDSAAKKITYGKSPDADFRIKDVQFDLNGTEFKIYHKENCYDLHTSLIGEFNAYNAACAFATAIIAGISAKVAIEGIKNTIQVPGRFEVIGRGSKKAIVDYSHTADSLEKALINLKKIAGNEVPVYTVFGCGGNRDKTKRPLMGKIATELSYKAIITNDNPRFEMPREIIQDILKGISKDNYQIIEDREEAIKWAIKNSEENAVILIAGKGHEDYQIINGIKNHFSDKEIAQKYL